MSLNIFIYKLFQTKNIKSFVPFFYLTIQNEKIENEKIFKHHHFLFLVLLFKNEKISNIIFSFFLSYYSKNTLENGNFLFPFLKITNQARSIKMQTSI